MRISRQKEKFTIATKSGFTFIIDRTLRVDEKIRDVSALLQLAAASASSKGRGVVDLSRAGEKGTEVKNVLQQHAAYLPPNMQAKVADGTLKFAVEPNLVVQAKDGNRNFVVTGSLGSAAERSSIANEAGEDSELNASSEWLEATSSGGTIYWYFSSTFRRPSTRIRATKIGAELLASVSEGEMARFEELWRSASEKLLGAYESELGVIKPDADRFSKLDPRTQQHLMNSFARNYAQNGFETREQAEVWLRGANIDGVKPVLFVAVGIRGADGKVSRVSFPLAKP